MLIAEVILKQLGGPMFNAMVRPTAIVALSDGVQFSIPKNASGANKVRIILDKSLDLYVVEFWKISRKATAAPVKIASADMLDVDQMRNFFSEKTGMLLRI
jgi:hypothetical protein